MNYCTVQDLIGRFGNTELIELSDQDNSGALNINVLQQAIDDADATIDGYIAGRYALPLTNPPVLLNKLACDMARYNLYDEGASEAVEKRFNDAIKFLVKAAEGKVSLGVVDGAEVQGESHAEIVSDGHVFSRDDNAFI